MSEVISVEKKLDLLVAEWKYLQDSSAWNFDIIEKQRNYGFVFIAAIFGVTGSSILNEQNQLWVLIPPIVTILLARITTQLEFINVRLNRILDIEALVSSLSGDSELLATESKLASDFKSATVYVITYLYIYLFFYSVLAFSLFKSYIYLQKTIGWYSWVYIVVFVITVFFLFVRQLAYTFGRYKKKSEVQARVDKA